MIAALVWRGVPGHVHPELHHVSVATDAVGDDPSVAAPGPSGVASLPAAAQPAVGVSAEVQ